MIAFVLAAGLGTRFRPETLTRPKSLLPLGGRPILFHAFDHLLGAGADAFVANGDVATTLPLGRLLAARHEPGVVSALAVLPNGNPSVDTPLWADAKGRLVAVGGGGPRGDATGPWLFTGLQAATPALALRVPAGFSELARDVLAPSARSQDGAFALVPYRTPADGFWFDLGTRDRLAAAEAAFAAH